MRVFILEDSPERIAGFLSALEGHDMTVCQWLGGTDGACERYKPPYDLLLLDHDLGGQVYVDSSEEETGAAFCSWLHGREGDPLIFIHSWNHPGAVNMQSILFGGGYNTVSIVPFGLDLLRFLKGLKS